MTRDFNSFVKTALFALAFIACGGESEGSNSTNENAEPASTPAASPAAAPNQPTAASNDTTPIAVPVGQTPTEEGDTETTEEPGTTAMDSEDAPSSDEPSDSNPPDDEGTFADTNPANPIGPGADDDEEGPLQFGDAGVTLPPGVDPDLVPAIDDSGEVVNPEGCPAAQPSGSCDGSATACFYGESVCGCLDGLWQCFDSEGFGGAAGPLPFGF